MSSRFAKSRQQPLGPDEGFDELLTRLINTNRIEKAQRDKANRNGPTVQRVRPRNSAAREKLER